MFAYLTVLPSLLLILLTGTALTRKLELPWSVRFGVGAAVVSQAVFVLLALSVATKAVVGGLILVWAVVALVWLRPCPVRAEFPRLPAWVWAAALCYAVLYGIHAAAPEIQADGYTYHLGLVKQWLATGGLTPEVGFYEMLPQGMESLFYLHGLFFGLGGVKLMHAVFILAGAWAIYDLGVRMGITPWPAMVLWGCSPVVGITGTAAYNDVALGFAVVCTVTLLWTGHWRLAALMAGWCYALKLPGLVFAAAAFVYIASRRRWRDTVVAGLLLAVMVGPWVARTWWMSGNPVAPLYNRWFPNEHFHVNTEEVTVDYLRSYGVDWLHRGWEVAVGGQKTTGLLGPVFLLTPLALLALRRREGRWLCGAALVALVPWIANAGTRFLIPAAALLAILLVMVLPRRLATGLAMVHAALSWPAAIPLYADAHAWHLRGLPWRAALGWENSDQYLSRELWEYRVAQMVNRHVDTGQVVLDFLGLPDLYANGRPMRTWQYAAPDKALDTIKTAMEYDQTRFYEVRAEWKAGEVRGVRVTNGEQSQWPWGLQEVTFVEGATPIRPRLSWELSASHHGLDAAMAMDSNWATRWQTWQERTPGMYWQAEFATPVRISGMKIICYRADAARLRFAGLEPDGQWKDLEVTPRISIPVALSLRRQATKYLQRQGFRWILVRLDGGGLEPVSRALVLHARDWGLEVVERLDGACLLSVRQ